MTGKLQREICNVCSKSIYLHDFVVICSLDGKISHSKCFGFTNDVSLDILNDDNWICPLCSAEIYPFFNTNYVSSLTYCCGSCNKLISNTNHCINICNLCSKRCHDFCMAGKHCQPCHANIISNTNYDSNYLNNYDHFNPYSSQIDNDFDFFDEDIDDYCETLQVACNILDNCVVMSP